MLIGGRGEDLLNLAASEGTDRIQGFSVGQDLIGLKGDLVFEDLTISNISDGAGELLLSSAASVLPPPLIRAILPSSSAIQAGDEYIGIVQGVPANQLNANSFALEA